MKTCIKCHGTKPLEDFNFRDKANKIYQPFCRACSRAAAKQSYQTNRQHYLSKTKERSKSQEIKYNTWKQTLSCSICDENHSWCIDFHHINSSTKDGTVSSFARRAGGRKFVEELEKCLIVCSNCHRKIHAGSIMIQESHVEKTKQMVLRFK